MGHFGGGLNLHNLARRIYSLSNYEMQLPHLSADSPPNTSSKSGFSTTLSMFGQIGIVALHVF